MENEGNHCGFLWGDWDDCGGDYHVTGRLGSDRPDSRICAIGSCAIAAAECLRSLRKDGDVSMFVRVASPVHVHIHVVRSSGLTLFARGSLWISSFFSAAVSILSCAIGSCAMAAGCSTSSTRENGFPLGSCPCSSLEDQWISSSSPRSPSSPFSSPLPLITPNDSPRSS
jgi:hypothetical protein